MTQRFKISIWAAPHVHTPTFVIGFNRDVKRTPGIYVNSSEHMGDFKTGMLCDYPLYHALVPWRLAPNCVSTSMRTLPR